MIRTAESKITATVAAFGKIKDSQYGEGRKFQSVLFEAPDLPDDRKHWKSMSPEEARQFKKGQRVYLIPVKRQDGRETYDIELMPDTTQPCNGHAEAMQTNTHQPLTPAQKREVAGFIDEMANLYGYALQVAQSSIGGSCDSETVRCMASTIYISAQRRFGLAEQVEFTPDPGARNSAIEGPRSSAQPKPASDQAQIAEEAKSADLPRRRPEPASAPAPKPKHTGVSYSPSLSPEAERVAAAVETPLQRHEAAVQATLAGMPEPQYHSAGPAGSAWDVQDDNF